MSDISKNGNVKKNKLLKQIARFGAVGVFCFVVDYVAYRVMNVVLELTGVPGVFDAYYLLSQLIASAISIVVNYLLSMKYVFSRREDISRKREFTVFVILSLIGLVINEICLYVGIDVMYEHWSFLRSLMSESFARNWFFKCAATGVVMVYNFISRKIFLDKGDS